VAAGMGALALLATASAALVLLRPKKAPAG
jgi:hypothetical protein